MKGTKIRWADHSWNPFVGCSRVSPGCDHCYAETIATKFRGTAFPDGFDPVFKPHKLGDVRKWAPARIFVNSMSDVGHEAFTGEQRDAVFDTMAQVAKHQYLVLTKRPKVLWQYLCGEGGWLERRGLVEVPDHIWLGVSIENDRYTFRADWLRRIPVPVRFLSCEPLIGPLPSLDLDGIGWVIVGGESGPGYRPMDHQWARDLRDVTVEAGVAYYFKQSAAARTEMGIELDGELWEQYPRQHPAAASPAEVPQVHMLDV